MSILHARRSQTLPLWNKLSESLTHPVPSLVQVQQCGCLPFFSSRAESLLANCAVEEAFEDCGF
jgi:hypothetical protein